MRSRYFRLSAAALALAGYWSPWLTHPTAALRLNGYELSEWVTFLPGVRSGELALSRLLFLLPLACLALLLAGMATRVPVPVAAPPLTPTAPAVPRPASGLRAALPKTAGPWGWPLLLLAALCALVVLPPYPYLLNALIDPEYQTQLFAGLATLLGVALVAYLPTEVKDSLQLALASAGAALGAHTLLTVRPIASALLNAPWPIGAGWLVMEAGFAALALAAVAQLFGARE